MAATDKRPGWDKAFLRWNLNLNMDYLPPDRVKLSFSFLSFCWCCCSLKQYSFECQSKGFCSKGPQDSLLECTLDLTMQNTAGWEQVFSDVQCHWPPWHYSQEQSILTLEEWGPCLWWKYLEVMNGLPGSVLARATLCRAVAHVDKCLQVWTCSSFRAGGTFLLTIFPAFSDAIVGSWKPRW